MWLGILPSVLPTSVRPFLELVLHLEKCDISKSPAWEHRGWGRVWADRTISKPEPRGMAGDELLRRFPHPLTPLSWVHLYNSQILFSTVKVHLYQPPCEETAALNFHNGLLKTWNLIMLEFALNIIISPPISSKHLWKSIWVLPLIPQNMMEAIPFLNPRLHFYLRSSFKAMV